MMQVELRFPVPNRPLSINEANKMRHWAAKRRRLDPWKEATQWAWKQQAPYQWIVRDKPTRVEVELPFTTKRRRDPHNFVGTVCKTIVDALVTKVDRSTKEVTWQGAWPDDTPEWVEVVDPVITSGTEVVVRLVPRSKSDV